MPYRGPAPDRRPITADDLLAAARAADADDPRERLRALCCVDAARWLMWPGPAADAERLEQVLRARGEPVGDDAPTALLRQSLAARQAVREGAYATAAAVLGDLPRGYPYKSLWLHQRDLLLRTGRLVDWNPTRSRLLAALQAGGVPASETLGALIGRLDLPRWRAEQRLAARMREQLSAMADDVLPRLTNDVARRVHQAAVGRELIRLGAGETAAAMVFEAGEDSAARRGSAGRLFSRPAPQAALWLRGAVDNAVASRSGDREPLAHHAMLALIALARRHRADHLLREALDPLPLRFTRADSTAAVLLDGALAWLGCGDPWRGHQWYVAGLRQLGRHGEGPLAAECLPIAAEWIERSADPASLPAFADLSPRLAGTGRLEHQAHLARLQAASDPEGGAERLHATYRAAAASWVDSPPRVVIACAWALLAGDQVGGACRLLRAALGEFDLEPLLPATTNADAEAAALRDFLADGAVHYDLAAAAVRALLACGRRAQAAEVQAAAERAVARLESIGSRLRGTVTLARGIVGGIDQDLAAAVERAVADEATLIAERLRTDEPPAQRSAASS